MPGMSKYLFHIVYLSKAGSFGAQSLKLSENTV